MLKKELTYEDIDGQDVTRTFWFHINEADWLRFNFAEKEGIEARMKQYIEDNDAGKIFDVFEDLIEMAYGVRNEEDKTFVKDPALTAKFMRTDAYSALLTELLSDPVEANRFLVECLPKKFKERFPADAPAPTLNVPVETLQLPTEPTVPTPEISPLGIPQDQRITLGEFQEGVKDGRVQESDINSMTREQLLAALARTTK